MQEKRVDRNTKKDIEFGAIYMLIGVFVFIVIASFLYSGTQIETQQECLELGQFKYDNKCAEWEAIPLGSQEKVMLEVADEIASTRGISRDQALIEILGVIENNSR